MAKSSTDPKLVLSALFENIEDSSDSQNTSDQDALPETALKKTWEDEVHRLLKHRYRNDTLARTWLACSTQALIFLWMVAVVVILMCNSHCFKLSDTVLVVILGTTTTTVLGLALIVLNGFFRYMKQDVDLKDRQTK